MQNSETSERDDIFMPIETLQQKKDRKLQRKRRSVMYWLNLTENQVLDIFAELPNARTIGKDKERCIYIPGTREDKVVLVAHADSVFTGRESKLNINYHNGIFSSRNKDVGIQADDRAGCAILWRLRNMGHSLLICNYEETGCIGSRALMNNAEFAKELNEHQFAIQFDRHGCLDLVFYNVGSDEFTKWCEEQFKGYKKSSGSSTDIRHLCTKMCGVNISVGYYSEHFASEKLSIKEWSRTLETTRKVLSQTGIPKFIRPPVVASTGYSNQNYNGYGGYDYRDRYHGLEDDTITYHFTKPEDKTKVIIYASDTLVKCPHCRMIQDELEYSWNNKACVNKSCNKAF